MSIRVTFDLKQLVRVCLNDPDLHAEVARALQEGPLPIRTACMNVVDNQRVYSLAEAPTLSADKMAEQMTAELAKKDQ